MEIECRDGDDEIPWGIFWKKWIKSQLFLFFLQFSNDHLGERTFFFFCERSKLLSVITECYIVPCVESAFS